MSTCLVTKLKATVNNPNIVRLNWFRLNIAGETTYGPDELRFTRPSGESSFKEKPVIIAGDLTATQTYTSSYWSYAYRKSANSTGIIEVYVPRMIRIDDSRGTIVNDITELAKYATLYTISSKNAIIDLDELSKTSYRLLKAKLKGDIVAFIGNQTSLTDIITEKDLLTQSELSGNISELTVPDTLASFDVDYSNISGSISALDLTNATELTTFRLRHAPNVTGSVSAFRALNPQITTVSFVGCNVDD